MNGTSKTLTVIFLSIMFLFFFQLTTALIEAIYTVNLLGSSMNASAAGIVWFLCSGLLFLLPAVFRMFRIENRGAPYRNLSLVFAGLVIVLRVVTPLMKTRPTIITAGAGVAFFLMFYPLYLAQLDQDEGRSQGLVHGISFSIALMASILFRSLGASLDISVTGPYQVVGWVLAGICLYAIIKNDRVLGQAENAEASPGKGGKAGFVSALGLLNLFILVIFGFGSPAVFARWTEGNYPAITILLAAVIAATVLYALLKPGSMFAMSPGALLAWNLFFTAMIVLAILAHTVEFPAAPGSDPEVVGAPLWYQQVPLFLVLVSSPVIIFNMIILTSRVIGSGAGLQSLAGGLTAGGFYFIILIFISIFTNVWGYVKPVSDLFRNLYWLPYLIMGTVMALGTLAAKNGGPGGGGEPSLLARRWTGVLAGLLFTSTVIAVLVVAPRPGSTEGKNVKTLTVMTYNIQQGNSATGEKNYDAQLEIIQQSGADIIALQESDTARIGLGNSDVVRYFATKLDYYSYYGPKTVTGTFGTAILSRYPILRGETLFTYSNLDETGTAYALIDVKGNEFHVFCSHPDGDWNNHMDQMKSIIDRVKEQSLDRVVSLGDFNTEPGSDHYNLAVSKLYDAWAVIHPTGIDGDGNDMSGRIDHIFVSREFTIEDARVIPAGPSGTDHPVFWVTISW